MFSSLIFAALAAAWLVVLVPMFARRRQEVSHTADSALAARVVRRGSGRSPTAEASITDDREETFAMPDTDRDRAGMHDAHAESEFDDQDDGQWRQIHSDDVRAGRRYRPGRGGFDPEAAALIARAKYARRQRIVLGMLVTVVVTAVLAAIAWPMLWWAHAGFDLVLVGFLTYLRRQVRIEEEVRSRRLARLSGSQDEDEEDGEEYEQREADDHLAEVGTTRLTDQLNDSFGVEADVDFDDLPPQQSLQVSTPPNAVVVEIDDEDPMFDELDERTWEPYRRAVGE